MSESRIHDERVIFRAGRQGTKVRAVLWGAVLLAILALWGGWGTANHMTLPEADGGGLAPPVQRIGWGVAIALLGVLPAVGMVVYGRCYVLRLVWRGGAETVRVETLRPFGRAWRDIHGDQVTGLTRYEGTLHVPRGHHVDAPWVSLRVAGRRLPFVVDLQGEFAPGADGLLD